MNKIHIEKRYTVTLDDDPTVHQLIQRITGITSLPFTHPDVLIKRAHSFHPVAAFIDIHLDLEVSGLDFVRELRLAWPNTPIFVVTSDTKGALVGSALALGAHDYLRKPFDPDELKGRLEARINEINARREYEELAILDIVFNRSLKTITKGESLAHVPNLEARLLVALAESLGMPISKDHLRARLWGKTVLSENALDKKISSLRKLLADVGSGIQVRSRYGAGVELCLAQSLAAA